jgi:hypothetical protein
VLAVRARKETQRDREVLGARAREDVGLAGKPGDRFGRRA